MKLSRRKQKLPPGWTEKRIREVLDYYENQTEDEQVAEHEAALASEGQTQMMVPSELVPAVLDLIASRSGRRRKSGRKASARD